MKTCKNNRFCEEEIRIQREKYLNSAIVVSVLGWFVKKILIKSYTDIYEGFTSITKYLPYRI
jgi:hypothetical protein